MLLTSKAEFIDLNWEFLRAHTSAPLRKEMVDEFRPNNFLAVDGVRSPLRVSSLPGTLPRSPQGQELLLLGSVLDHGFCPADLSGEPQRYRGLSAHDTRPALPHGHSQSSLSQHSGPRQS